MKKLFDILVIALAIVGLSACGHKKTLFDQLSPKQTGIHFSNRILENDTFNILAYEYVYNGGGVGIGDFNNDGLEDVFFTGNNTGNRLYLNRGNFKFEDITADAGVAAKDRWNSGVAVVDINNDGLLDLYVCATTYKPGHRRANSLFVNTGAKDGVPGFSEQAAAYGIADTSHTMNAAFFDYDNDGDLDLYLLVNQMDEEKLPNRYRQKVTDGSSRRTDKLFRNDFDAALGHPVFTDVSKETGITIEGFGLGVNICDINRDGWKDIYVTNDYLTNDLLWINNGANGKNTFTDKAPYYLKHTCHSAMGNDVTDLNNDGLADIVALDMLPENNFRRKTMLMPNNYTNYLNNERYGYQYQYVRNTLQLNDGNRPDTGEPVFSEISMFAGIAATDWSWAPLVADFDNDGFRDLIITNGFPNDVTDRDFIDYNNDKGSFLTRKQLLEMIPSVKIKNYAFRNHPQTGSAIPQFDNVTEAWGITENSFSNGAAYADLDNDGDLDYIVNNINDSAFVFKNLLVEKHPTAANWLKIKFEGPGLNRNGLGAIAEIFYGDHQQQYWDNTPCRGYLSSVESGAHFGLGAITAIDSVVITWQEGKRAVYKNVNANQVLAAKISDANPFTTGRPSQHESLFADVTSSLQISYLHPESDYIDFNVQRLLPHKLSQFGPGIAAADVNGDGLDDFYISGSHFNKGKFFLQKTNGTFVMKDLLPGADGDAKREEELGVLFFDADNDGDNDLYLVSGGYEFPIKDTVYQDRLFVNENGRFRWDKEALPAFLSSGSCVKASDFDKDGDLDLFIGGRVLPFEYPTPVSSYLLVNDGKGHFTIANDRAPGLNDCGLVCDALWTDIDNDGWDDLLLAGEWMPLTVLKNDKGKLTAGPLVMADGKTAPVGWWNSLVAGDFDLDGDMDYIAGNLGLNTLMRADDTSPIAVYAADFDGNSGLDVIPSVFFPDKQGKKGEYPFFGRADIEKQVVKVKGFYPHHYQFGEATMSDFVSKFPKAKPLVLKANYLQTSYFQNEGNGTFSVRALPLEAQLAPVFGMIAGDFNGDGRPDVMLSGNDYSTEVSMGRYDALNGLLLLGDGKGNFEPQSMQKSGIAIPGDGKSLAQLQAADGSMLVVAGQNKGPLKVFKASQLQGEYVALERNDRIAIVKLKDGRSYRQELSYGQSFLSQSVRKLWLPATAVSCEIENQQGSKRSALIQ